MSVPYQLVFSRSASPFVRWCLSPFLLLFGGLFFFPLMESMEEGRQMGVIACSLLIILCVAGVLALWGVPLVGRIVSGIIALASGYYLVDQCIVNFDGDWGWGKPQSETTPINSIGSFLIFGLPCLIYTVLGRFTLLKEDEVEADFDWDDACEDEADVRDERDGEDEGSRGGEMPNASRRMD